MSITEILESCTGPVLLSNRVEKRYYDNQCHDSVIWTCRIAESTAASESLDMAVRMAHDGEGK